MDRVLNNFVYEKGGWVLHMLRSEIGADVFWSGIREYYGRYRDRNASTDDLRQVMEQVSGKDLKWFFAQWLNRGGTPKLETTWHYDASSKSLQLALRQTQGGEAYRLRVEVEIATASGKHIQTVPVEGTSTTVSFPLDTSPLAVVVDPGTWLLADLSTQ
jgi:aminopeptidase N